VVLRDVGWSGMDWFNLVQLREQWKALVNMVMNLQVPQSVKKFLKKFLSSFTSCGGFSRRAQLHGVRFLFFSNSQLVASSCDCCFCFKSCMLSYHQKGSQSKKGLFFRGLRIITLIFSSVVFVEE
jgi:hypothetical protein